jgi:hypothetical protein
MYNLVSVNKRTGEKKTEPLTIKIEAGDKATLERIGETADRPLGYVARELMLRGLAAYKRDGLLKEPAQSTVDPETRQREALKRLIYAEAKTTPDPVVKRRRKVSGE